MDSANACKACINRLGMKRGAKKLLFPLTLVLENECQRHILFLAIPAGAVYLHGFTKIVAIAEPSYYFCKSVIKTMR